MAVKPTCEPFVPTLSPFVDGELDPLARARVQEHLSGCADCTGRVADLRASSNLVRAGLEMAAEDVAWDGFAERVMAKVTPARLPWPQALWVSWQERWTYQRGYLVLAAGAAAAAVALAVATPARLRAPEGYANEHMALGTVSTDESAHVAPVVLETDNGDSIIWVVDHEHVQALGVPDASYKEVDSQGTSGQNGTKPPTGGTL